jgi:hypothetical protein
MEVFLFYKRGKKKGKSKEVVPTQIPIHYTVEPV